MLFDPIDSAARFEKIMMRVPADRPGSTGKPGLLRHGSVFLPHPRRQPLRDEADFHPPAQVSSLLQRETEDAGPHDGKAVRAVPQGGSPFELEATIININVGCNRELMDACKTLADYARYTQLVRDYAEEMPLNQAVERAVTECIREGILEEFLRENRS